MGVRDQKLVREMGIPLARIAESLGVTRQTIHERVNRNTGNDYLTEERLSRVYAWLKRNKNPDLKEKASRLAQTARVNYSMVLNEPGEETAISANWDYYLIFSNQPFELEESNFLPFMTSSVFTCARLVTYFMGPNSAFKDLIEVIEQRKKDLPTQWTATLYIVTTPAADLIPHIALVRDQSKNQWEGRVFDLENGIQSWSQLRQSYITRLLHILGRAGFAFDVNDAPGNFMPRNKKTKALMYRGISFTSVYRYESPSK